jgi:hypothetical protein
VRTSYPVIVPHVGQRTAASRTGVHCAEIRDGPVAVDERSLRPRLWPPRPLTLDADDPPPPPPGRVARLPGHKPRARIAGLQP